ncbi:MAG: hypothetical protein ACODAB_00605 [Gemmatimonadota bacterium]
MTPRRSSAQIWTAPVVIGILSLVGLLAALLGDGVADVLSWLALAVPVGVSVWSLRVRDSGG